MVNVLILADEDHIRESLKELVSTNPLLYFYWAIPNILLTPFR